jgi:hypothetical protein|tara:strand:- start:167 stop:367 length:201 start_codon:yes stop_codon:yes gene_type:complete
MDSAVLNLGNVDTKLFSLLASSINLALMANVALTGSLARQYLHKPGSTDSVIYLCIRGLPLNVTQT